MPHNHYHGIHVIPELRLDVERSTLACLMGVLAAPGFWRGRDLRSLVETSAGELQVAGGLELSRVFLKPIKGESSVLLDEAWI